MYLFSALLAFGLMFMQSTSGVSPDLIAHFRAFIIGTGLGLGLMAVMHFFSKSKARHDQGFTCAVCAVMLLTPLLIGG